MKFVLLSDSNKFKDGAVVASTVTVEYDSITQLLEDLAKNSFWSVSENSAFKVTQVVPYADVKSHL